MPLQRVFELRHASHERRYRHATAESDVDAEVGYMYWAPYTLCVTLDGGTRTQTSSRPEGIVYVCGVPDGSIDVDCVNVGANRYYQCNCHMC